MQNGRLFQTDDFALCGVDHHAIFRDHLVDYKVEKIIVEKKISHEGRC